MEQERAGYRGKARKRSSQIKTEGPLNWPSEGQDSRTALGRKRPRLIWGLGL